MPTTAVLTAMTAVATHEAEALELHHEMARSRPVVAVASGDVHGWPLRYEDVLAVLVNVALLAEPLTGRLEEDRAAVLAAIRYGAKPADTNHPFGHHKVEYFSVVFEGVLIIVAAISIFAAAWQGFLNPRPLDEPAAGLAINAVAGVINGIWAFVLIRRGRALRSPEALICP